MEKKGYVVTHTHWDREWRYPIWESRIYLAEMLDELLDVLDEQPDYNSFLFDGQSVFLEDYLMLRPQNKERLVKHIKDKRLVIGPWYTLPDLYPVSGESLVRNLLKGDRVCNEYGHKLDIGYESFGWGKPSQFPQIYKGFGIDTVVVAKRVSERRAPESEFIWEGKDGTRLLTTRLGKEARANFFMHTYMEAMSGRKYKSDEFQYHYGQNRFYHQADPKGSEQDFFMLNHHESIHEDNLKELVMESWNAIEDTLLKEDRILMDGSDSTSAQPQILKLIDKINESLKEDNITLVHSSMEEYVALLKEKLLDKELRVVYGELRDGPSPSVSANALMTRYPVKKKNKEAEKSLMDIAEPLSVAGSLMGIPYDRTYLSIARDYLLGSQSHDSINGVTQDKTVRDVMYRLDQVIELSYCVKEQALRYLAMNIAKENLSGQELLLLLVNPLPQAREEIIRVMVDIPREKNIWDFTVCDMEGNELPLAHISRKEVVTPTVNRHTRPEPYYADRHEILLNTGMLPAGGYQVVKLVPKQELVRAQKFWPPTRMSDGQELGISATEMENSYLKVMVQPDGSVVLKDKETGYVTERLNYLESEGDIGDYWIHYPPYHNQIYSSTGVSADICMEENTPLEAAIRVSYRFRVPAFSMRPEAGIQGDSGRSSEMTEIPVIIRYSLKKDDRKLNVQLQVTNTARDHRMSMKFNSNIQCEGVDAGGHFSVDHRGIQAANEKENKRYTEMDPAPMQGFVDVCNGEQGFGVLSEELLEYDASRPGILSCTLYRAVRDIICTEFRSGSSYPSQEGGQLLETMEYSYSLILHRGNWEQAYLARISRCLSVPVLPVQFNVEGEQDGFLPMKKSFYEVTGAEVSCIKFSEDRDSIVLRIYNTKSEVRAAVVRFAVLVKEAFLINMNEEVINSLPVVDGCINFVIKPDKIVTMEIRL